MCVQQYFKKCKFESSINVFLFAKNKQVANYLIEALKGLSLPWSVVTHRPLLTSASAPQTLPTPTFDPSLSRVCSTVFVGGAD